MCIVRRVAMPVPVIYPVPPPVFLSPSPLHFPSLFAIFAHIGGTSRRISFFINQIPTSMADDIIYQVNVQMADNTMTPDNPNDKIFTVVNNGTAGRDRIIQEMMAVNPGLERETLAMVLDLKNRVCRTLLLQGMRVNDGFCNAALTCRGLVQGTAWDPAANSLYANMQPSQELRDVLERQVHVNVVGERPSAAFIATGEDVATKAEGNVTQPGSIYTVRGKKIKVEGTDPSVGLYFVSSTGTETKVTQLAVNNPSEVTFVVPSSLDDGSYTLRIVTQYSAGANLLKEPRVLESTVYIGDAPVQEGGSSSGGGSGEGNEGSFG